MVCKHSRTLIKYVVVGFEGADFASEVCVLVEYFIPPDEQRCYHFMTLPTRHCHLCCFLLGIVICVAG